MKNLLIKEIRLASSPLSWFFLAFSAMTLIPNYPILLSAFFVCFGIFHSFQNSRENNDLLYTVLLPVSKADAVRSKYAFTMMIQLLAFILSTLFTLVRMVFLQGIPYANNPMMTANQTYLAWILVVYALFNSIFLGSFFKTGWKLGKPFLIFCIAAFLTVTIAEVLHHLPGCLFLNDVNSLSNLPMWGITFVALILWAGCSILSMQRAIRQFAMLDL